MTRDDKRFKFYHLRESLEAAGLATNNSDALICPLCWRETSYDDLSLEHMVPGTVGGTQRTLTCRTCNNDGGSNLDAHLSRYQVIADVFKGHGTLPAKISVKGKEVAANLEWGEDAKNFTVVGKASNPVSAAEIQQAFADGKVKQMNVTLPYKYSKNNFQTAVLRAAYLIVFQYFGYEWASHDVVQTIRRRIDDPSLELPRLASLVVELRNFNPPHDAQHYVVSRNVNDVKFLLAIVRVRKKTTSYLGAYLPVPLDGSERFFDLMEQAAKEHPGQSFKIPMTQIFT
ncbi:hypothetical protein EC9_44650 [Rosistilla ulvae]|uniref:HNH endonuclease 5 domain-containing protein n=1 Tax=Rosistilla ulvae TaxID=1930277 RepID=A0A517M5W4_9BACT|nr:HNH endonuclease [Rosistilla ulvae]QDS90258.1 hypothetical protein EC9_44650 [Rosistilla ulvae]